jgi:hypothetical protein
MGASTPTPMHIPARSKPQGSGDTESDRDRTGTGQRRQDSDDRTATTGQRRQDSDPRERRGSRCSSGTPRQRPVVVGAYAGVKLGWYTRTGQHWTDTPTDNMQVNGLGHTSWTGRASLLSGRPQVSRLERDGCGTGRSRPHRGRALTRADASTDARPPTPWATGPPGRRFEARRRGASQARRPWLRLDSSGT